MNSGATEGSDGLSTICPVLCPPGLDALLCPLGSGQGRIRVSSGNYSVEPGGPCCASGGQAGLAGCSALLCPSAFQEGTARLLCINPAACSQSWASVPVEGGVASSLTSLVILGSPVWSPLGFPFPMGDWEPGVPLSLGKALEGCPLWKSWDAELTFRVEEEGEGGLRYIAGHCGAQGSLPSSPRQETTFLCADLFFSLP